MTKLAALLLFLTFPVRGYSQLVPCGPDGVPCPGAPQRSQAQANASQDNTDSPSPGTFASVGLLPRDLFGNSNGAVDNGEANPSWPGNSPQAKHEKPHLIELSAANWRPLTRREKFDLFDHDLVHWETHVSLALDAGISSAIGDRSYLGTGASGYFRRYGLNVADEVDFAFFNGFFFPTLFHEDPRYIPSDHGTVCRRMFYALSRVAVTRNDSGKSEFNKSRVFGTVVATSVSTGYYSAFGADVGVDGNFENIGINLGSDAAFDLFKEFWPDVARKLKLNVWIRNLVRASIRDEIGGGG
jgi:hypothetical protein